MKHKPQNFKIEIEFCDHTVHVYIIENPTEFRNGKFLKMWPGFSPYLGGDFYAMHTCDPSYPRRSFMILPIDVDALVVMHEAIHVVDRMMEFYNFEGTEFRAHLAEHVVKETAKKIKLCF